MKRPPEALRSPKLFENGCGYLVINRFKADGRVETGFFLLDLFCLGVKDAGFHQFSSARDLQESLLNALFHEGEPVRMSPAAGRKLAEDAVAYARDLGFSPAADYRKASRVFGGISPADCDEEFVFGKDGKPFYIQGPSDPPARCEQILRVLEARCGEGGYHYIVAADETGAFDDEEESEASIRHTQGTGDDDPLALEAMAARIRADGSGTVVRVNPPGRKVSDMIALVAAPLVESAPGFAAKSQILTLAAVAWNFSLLPPTAQKEFLPRIAEMFPDPEAVEIFAWLVARAVALFPDERPAICQLETDPAPDGEIALRVASAR